ncbi:hypothetical protein RSAG8_03790, partial [Rhizoctonia solani AG-8 WAC10335]
MLSKLWQEELQHVQKRDLGKPDMWWCYSWNA